MLKITRDCSPTHIMNYLPKVFPQKHGISGCTAGKRFLTILANRNVYPCSFLEENYLFLGNIPKQTFATHFDTSLSVKKLSPLETKNRTIIHRIKLIGSTFF